MLDLPHTQTPLLRALCAPLVVALSLAACSEEDHPTPMLQADSGGAAGAEPAGTGGSQGLASGGTSAASSTSSATGSGGMGTTTANGTGGAGGELGAAGALGEGPPEVVDICVRLTNAQGLAGALAVEFDTALDQDCRVSRFLFLYVLEASYERAAFLNALTRFNLAIWGCSAALPREFDLIYLDGLAEDMLPVTPADVGVLIEDYLATTNLRLGLSPEEESGVRAYLEWLSRSVVSEQAEGYSRSTCAEGGAGGEGGSSN